MEKEKEEIQSVISFYGIFRESFTIIFSCKKLLSQITIATIFPLSLLFLSHVQMSEFFFADILHNEEGSFKNPNNVIWGSLWSEKMAFLCFKMVYVIFFLVISLVSTSTVAHVVACVYTRKEVSFGEAVRVVPKVWKRLLVTFAWSFIVIIVYNMTTFSLLFRFTPARISISGPFFLIYMIGFVYISILWHLASVVSVLEEECGIEAMIKSKALVKGRMVIIVAVFLLLNLCFILIQGVFQRFVVVGGLFWSRIMFGMICFLFLSGFTLLGQVTQTIIYFVCKSCHYGIINKSCFTNGVQVYLGDYAPLSDVDVQLDHC